MEKMLDTTNRSDTVNVSDLLYDGRFIGVVPYCYSMFVWFCYLCIALWL